MSDWDPPSDWGGWDYLCPACGARVSSGWADQVCPMPGCHEILDLVSGPSPSREEIDRVLREAEDALRG
jgi:hypothetical protein